MRKTALFGVLAAVGLAASASAQQTIEVSFSFSNANPLPGETVSVTLQGQVVNPTDALSLGAVRGDVSADAGVGSGAVFANNARISPFTLGNDGVFNAINGYTLVDAGYNGSLTGGPGGPPAFPTPMGMDSPVGVWAFDYTVPAGFVGGEVVTFNYAGSGSIITTWGHIPGFGWFGGGPTIVGLSGTGELNVLIPAPGSMALLGLGGLVAIRRRRA